MSLEAHLNNILRNIKFQVILTFIGFEHNILNYWSFPFEELQKNPIIISCFLCGIFWFFQHPHQILHTKIMSFWMCSLEIRTPTTCERNSPHRITFHLYIISSKLMNFVFLSPLCHTFRCRKILQDTSPNHTASHKRRKKPWGNFK